MSLSLAAIEQLQLQLGALQINQQLDAEALALKHSLLVDISLQLLQKLPAKNLLPSNLTSLEAVYKYLHESTVWKPYFPLNTPHAGYLLLTFLATNVQASHLQAWRAHGDTRRQKASNQAKLLFKLDKICRDLGVTVTNNTETTTIVQTLQSSVQTLHEQHPNLSTLLQHPPVILQCPPLNPAQTAIVSDINQGLLEDFSLRRRMLLKRLDVTIQSFLWGEKAVGKEGEIVAAIQEQRSTLTEQPKAYSIEDAFATPLSLLAENEEKVTETFSGLFAKSLVKSVVIGAVPDRGGRASSIRSKVSSVEGAKGDKAGHKPQHKKPQQQQQQQQSMPEGGGEQPMEVIESGDGESPRGVKREGEHKKHHKHYKKKH